MSIEENPVAGTQTGPAVVVERLGRAINHHDLEAMLECFDPDYRSEQPAHPNRGFGDEQIRTVVEQGAYDK